jgi:polyhydroxyalkanoate synthesis repressor PhaR
MPSERIIKKYPNRRLYDTELSRYITLADVRDLVMKGTSFRVTDTANDADLTRSILLQIMLEEETGGEPLFTAVMLAQIIRFYGGTLQGLFARYLEHSLDTFASQQKHLTEGWGDSPFEAIGRIAQRNMDFWADAQKSLLRAAGFDVKDKPAPDEPDDTPAADEPTEDALSEDPLPDDKRKQGGSR